MNNLPIQLIREYQERRLDRLYALAKKVGRFGKWHASIAQAVRENQDVDIWMMMYVSKHYESLNQNIR